MRIGITYDLRDDYLREGFSEEETAEFDRIGTIESIEGALKKIGYETDRIGHARSLISRLAKGDRWDIVFNIAEGMYGVGREAQVPAILDTFNIPYTFSDPLVLSLTLHKAMTKQVIRDMGIPTPDFAVVEVESDIKNVALPFPLFAKPVAEGTGKGITPSSRIKDREELTVICRNLLATYKQPVLVETFLPGRELTVGIIGAGSDAMSVGALEVELLQGAEKDVYSYVNKEKCEELVKYILVRDPLALKTERLALEAWRGLGCRDAGRVDFRVDAHGTPCFLEINPLAGIHPEHSDLPILCSQAGIKYVELIEMIMLSALSRLDSSPNNPHHAKLIKMQEKYKKESGHNP